MHLCHDGSRADTMLHYREWSHTVSNTFFLYVIISTNTTIIILQWRALSYWLYSVGEGSQSRVFSCKAHRTSALRSSNTYTTAGLVIWQWRVVNQVFVDHHPIWWVTFTDIDEEYQSPCDDPISHVLTYICMHYRDDTTCSVKWWHQRYYNLPWFLKLSTLTDLSRYMLSPYHHVRAHRLYHTHVVVGSTNGGGFIIRSVTSVAVFIS